jgi:CHASE3 domain sensor protein
MIRRPLEPFRVFASGVSLRRRVAYSLAIVRLILVPVILLAIYYLFAMGRIVDRIVSVDAPVATLAQRASIEMLDARRAERNYFLLHDAADLEANHQALLQLEQAIATCGDLQPEERPAVEKIQALVKFYRQRFQDVIAQQGQPVQTPLERIRGVVRTHQKELNDILKNARKQSRGRLVEDLRSRVEAFDAQMITALEADNPAVRQATADLRTSSDEILRLASDLEKRGWERVQRSHEEAGILVHRAEWVLIIVSSLTILLSVWVSFTLPRAVVKPLVDLKSAVDHAAGGNYEIEFDLKGEAEVVQLAESVKNLIAHLREKKNNSGS